ncbi:DUF3311 domain-containing protein [Kitasatospora sp. GP82]|uniref:DUF3311 domain-containing protein n=1 Tax=Kitasatospora sp. GP82 TaxID=3035089 RepID=UPI002472FDB9|nr:DUF3311 domain-containing protein [Kitasatospora sp. GP82]MDH6123327.1 membrane protein implicated in regulation of membrane protease activity [Kitasatospora sp. GP82]
MSSSEASKPDTGASPGTVPVVTPERVLAGISLLVPIVAMLWVSSYAKVAPEAGGMPFFYWYQLLWVPVSAVFTVAAYLLLQRDEKARRAAVQDGGQA